MTGKSNPAHSKVAGPVLGTVWKTVAQDAGSLPRGGTKGKAQSERAKRGPRQSDETAASSAQRSGDSHSTRSAQGGSPAPASEIAQGVGTNSGNLLGLVVLCPDNNPLQPAKPRRLSDMTVENQKQARGTIRHGTAYAYKRHGCRCDECRSVAIAAVTRYRRECGIRPVSEICNPCEKDGTVYASQRAAAHALGVCDSTIEYHLSKYGNLDRVGGSRAHTKGGPRVPVKIGGREWPSRPEFAAYLGVPVTTLRGWLRRNDHQRIMGALMKADANAANVKVAA